MTLQIEFTWLIGLFVLFVGALWALGKVLIGQFDKRIEERFKGQEKNLDTRFAAQEVSRTENKEHLELRFNQLESLARKTEQDVQNLRVVLPAEYVRREDWIRFSVGIDHKFDTIYTALNDIREKLNA